MKKIFLTLLISFNVSLTAQAIPFIIDPEGPLPYSCLSPNGSVLYNGWTIRERIGQATQQCYANGGRWLIFRDQP